LDVEKGRRIDLVVARRIEFATGAAEASHVRLTPYAHRRSNRVDVIVSTAGSFVLPDVLTELTTIEETIGWWNA